MKQALELRCALMLTVSPLLAAGPSAFAQDEISSTAKQEHEGPYLEEIVVTADRSGFGADLVQAGSFRGARQLDTPLTVERDPEGADRLSAGDEPFDALRNTAGVTAAQTSPTVYNNLSIRGIEVENRGNYRLNGTLPIVNLTTCRSRTRSASRR